MTNEPQQATPEQALDALYQLSRQVNLAAAQHDAMAGARDIVLAALHAKAAKAAKAA